MASGIAVVIPCYGVTAKIATVIGGIGPEVDRIYCVDDACPEKSGDFIRQTITDQRVTVLFHSKNKGVGGATITGYRAALADGAEVIVKLDGDDQMDASYIPTLALLITSGKADYAKGNRFFQIEDVQSMPRVRIFGNAALSFFSKMSTGYWNIFDPTNGYTAIHARVLSHLALDKVSNDYFFESDMLFRLNILGATVIDVPMKSRYGDEISGLKIARIVLPFLRKHAVNFFKRIFYSYYLRDFNIASIELFAGIICCFFGACFGISSWIESATSEIPATSGTVMLSALPVLIGVQLLLSFLNFDIQRTPSVPLHIRFAGGN